MEKLTTNIAVQPTFLWKHDFETPSTVFLKLFVAESTCSAWIACVFFYFTDQLFLMP
jgi:hypothetical protein